MAVRGLPILFQQPQQSSLGAELGSGLGQGLQLLAQQKLQDLAGRQTARGLEALQFSPEQAQQLAQLDPSVLQTVVKEKLQAPQRKAFSQALSGILGIPSESVSEQATVSPFGETEQVSVAETVPERPSPVRIPAGINEQQALKFAELGLKKSELEKKEKSARFKETKAERKEILDKARAAKQNLNDLERMEELEQEGKLDTPGWIEFLKRSGLDIPALMSPGSEEFQKIAQTFMRDVKQYLGARISNFELEQFLKTIPSLSQSPEGRKRVISNLKRTARISLEYNNALKDVMKENKGVPPFDLLEQVDDRVDKKMDAISKKFKEDLAKPVPKAQRSIDTLLQSVAGEIIGAPGRVLSGVGHLLTGS